MGLVMVRMAEAEGGDPFLYQEGMAYFERVISIAPEHIDSWANRAYIKGRLESLEVMNEEFERLVGLHPQDLKVILLFYWAKLLEMFEQPEKAEEKRMMAREINPNIESQIELFSM